MPDLFLHVGHEKTGSSFIQSVLAANISELRDRGINYPAPPDNEIAAAGKVSMGNGALLLDHLGESGAEAPPWAGIGTSSVLFSRELFFMEFLSGTCRERLQIFQKAHGFQSLRILLFIRNPIRHATSKYVQEVKGGGLASSIEAYFPTYDFPSQVEKFFDAFPSATMTVCNYSSEGDRLLHVVEEWLDLPPDTLRPPANRTVNRSLTRAELEFIRELNAARGEPNFFLSQALTEQLPNLSTEDLRPGEEIQEALWKRIEPVIFRVNSRLDRGAHYRNDVAPVTSGPSALSFSGEQIRIIANNLGDQIIGERERLITVQEHLVVMEEHLVAMEEHLAAEQKRGARANAAAQFFKGKFKEKKGLRDESIRAFRKALTLDPEHVPSLLCLADLLRRTDPLDPEAQNLFEKARTLKPDSQAVKKIQSKWDRSSPPPSLPDNEA